MLGNGRRTTGAGTVVQGVNCNPPDIDHRINAYTVTTATYCYMEKQRECVNIILYYCHMDPRDRHLHHLRETRGRR